MNLIAIIWIAGMLAPPAPPRARAPSAGPDLVPYVETRTTGAYVDWLAGSVGVIGRSRIFRDIARSQGYYEQTRLSADRDGQAKVISLLAEVPRDGGARLGEDADQLKRLEERVRRAPRGAVLSDTGPLFKVEQSHPLWGPGSILEMVLTAMPAPVPSPATTTAAKASMEGPAPAPGSSGASVTGLIVDARQVDRPAAALLPRILDEKGRVVFGIEVADRGRALESGLAAYVLAGPRGGEKAAAGARQGASPMRVRAISTIGATRADLVISTDDADQILKAAAEAPFLKECRVVVLMPAVPSHRAGRAPRPGASPPPATAPPGQKKP
ncbi:MAG TPA: hypothetical protein VGK94_12285 [Candidatus Polarisedimenticolia bacterium]|jgi:hypothetical protein